MAAISTLGYFCIQANDLDAWERFATHLPGMQFGAHADGMRHESYSMSDSTKGT